MSVDEAVKDWRAAVWLTGDLDAHEKLVALCYADHTATGYGVWVYDQRGGARCAMGVSTFRRKRKSLEDKGWLVLLTPGRRGRQSLAATYMLAIPDNAPSGRNGATTTDCARCGTHCARSDQHCARCGTPLPTYNSYLSEDTSLSRPGGRDATLNPDDDPSPWIVRSLERDGRPVSADEQYSIFAMLDEKGYEPVRVLNTIRKQRRENPYA